MGQRISAEVLRGQRAGYGEEILPALSAKLVREYGASFGLRSFRSDSCDLIDDYLETCAEMGKAPDKPASGNIGARISPIAHGAGLAAAEREGKSFNQWLEALIVEKTGVALA